MLIYLLSKGTKLLDTFMDSLNNRDLELAVFQGRPRSLQEAVNIGLEYEAFQVTRQRWSVGSSVREFHVSGSPSDQSNESEVLAKRVFQLESQLESLRVARADTPFETKPTREPEVKRGACFSCGEIGHFKVNCPKRLPSQCTSKVGIQKGRHRCEFCGRSGHVEKNCWDKSASQNVPVAQCMFCGQKGHFMIDCVQYQQVTNTNLSGKDNLKGQMLK